MSHIHLHEIYTACAHTRFLDTISLSQPHSQHAQFRVEHDAIFRFGWCPACETHISSPLCRQGRAPLPLRDPAVLRSYWRFKALNQMDHPVPAHEIPYSALDPSVPQRHRNDHAFGESALLWEERALCRALADVAPKRVCLGPLLFVLPLLEDAWRNMLRGARQWTILWAKGDEALYRKDPGLDLNRPWHPSDDEGWEIKRFYQPYRPLPPEREYLRRR